MRSSRSLGPVVLLALALVLVAVLAFQAQDAARSHRRAAESALRDYASFADWQLTQQAKNNLLATIITSLSFPASRVDPERLPASLATPAEIGADARATVQSWCRCLDSVRYYFRYDWSDGSFRTTDTDLPDASLAWARDTIVAHARSLAPVTGQRPTTFGSPDGRYGPLRQLAVLLTNDSYALIFGDDVPETSRTPVPITSPQLLVLAVVRDVDGEPIVGYGYATAPRPFLSPTFDFVHQRSTLLPPSLLGSMPADSILSISVTTLPGNEVYRSPGYFSRTYAAEDTVEAGFGRLIMRVAIRPDLAGRLLVGGLPRSRLPVLVGVFVLTAGLLAISLMQLRKQQELARLRTDFVSGVSHELRTPLAQIRWFAELLHLGKLRSDEERARSARIIDQEARRLTYLVENVLNYARGEKGANRLAIEPLTVGDEVREALEMFAPLARAGRASLRSTVPEGLTVAADRDAIRQILLNLLDNAVKYGRPGQTITVGAESAGASSPAVRLWVEDEGLGIAVDDRERVWEPYVRLPAGVAGATGGSGIGLSVVRELATLHGGTTWVEGRAAGGAKIVIELPVRDVQTPAGASTETAVVSEPTDAGAGQIAAAAAAAADPARVLTIRR